MRSARYFVDKLCEDRGSSSLEFITVGLILLIPLVYLVLTLGQIQAATLAVEGAARHSARAWVRAPQSIGSQAFARQTLAGALNDFGLNAQTAVWEVRCSADCGAPGSRVWVRVKVRISLPLVPPVLNVRDWASVLIEARATQTVSRFGLGR